MEKEKCCIILIPRVVVEMPLYDVCVSRTIRAPAVPAGVVFDGGGGGQIHSREEAGTGGQLHTLPIQLGGQ